MLRELRQTHKLTQVGGARLSASARMVFWRRKRSGLEFPNRDQVMLSGIAEAEP
jgi:hypothetical protein